MSSQSGPSRMVVTMARPSLRKLYTVSKGARKDTDSYTLLSYLLAQNAGIANGTVTGTPINLKFLGVGDGLTVRSVSKVIPSRIPHWEYTGCSLAVPRLHLVCGF